jgi:hypothetical protein
MNDIDSQDIQSEELRSGKGRRSGGGRIEMRDSRFSMFLGLLWTALGAIALGLLAWAASSISELNINVSSMKVEISGLNRRLDVKDARDDRQDDQISEVKRDVYTLEGKNLRGGPEVSNGR